MKVTGWCKYKSNIYNSYKELDSITEDNLIKEYNGEDVEECIIKELKDKGIRFDGPYHQNGDYGIPIIDDKFVVMGSYRWWGALVAEADGLKRDFAYMDWYMVDEEQEKKVCLPKPEWYSK